jgi:hypothetical protein
MTNPFHIAFMILGALGDSIGFSYYDLESLSPPPFGESSDFEPSTNMDSSLASTSSAFPLDLGTLDPFFLCKGNLGM